MALPRQAFRPFIADGRARETHQRDQAPQEDIHFPKFGKMLQDAGGDQAVVRVVEDNFGPECLHQPVEALRGRALEEGILIPPGADAVDDFRAFQVFLHHPVHRVDVVLAVAVDGDRDIAAVLCLHQAGQHRVLMAQVPALADPDIMFVRSRQFPDDVPGPVFRAVVDEQDPAVCADPVRFRQFPELLQEHRGRQGKHLLLVVAGDHDPQNRSCAHFAFLSKSTVSHSEAEGLPYCSEADGRRILLANLL